MHIAMLTLDTTILEQIIIIINISIKMKKLKQQLDNGEVLMGTFLSLGHPITTEIIAGAGFDWVIIDLEHGLGSESGVSQQLQALKSTNVAAIVRVEGYQRQRIHRVLDLGADGIMCPRIDNGNEAALAVRAMQYPPEGIRGVAKMVRATNYGEDFDNYQKDAPHDLLGVIQIETLSALDHLDEIAATKGVDVLFIGPSDLSMALGIFGQMDHPLFVKAVDSIIRAAKKANKHVGILLMRPEDLGKFYDLGVRFFACGTDALFLSKGAKQMARDMRKSCPER